MDTLTISGDGLYPESASPMASSALAAGTGPSRQSHLRKSSQVAQPSPKTSVKTAVPAPVPAGQAPAPVPAPAPTPVPEPVPTPAPTTAPTLEATPAPTPAPTLVPTPAPTPTPTPAPTLPPTPALTVAPTVAPAPATTAESPPEPIIQPSLVATEPPGTAMNFSMEKLMDEIQHPGVLQLPPGNFTLQSQKANIINSPVLFFVGDLSNWLHDPASPQIFIAIISSILGLCLCGCGSMIWRGFCALCIAAAGGCFVLYENESIPHLTPGLVGNGVLATQVALTLFFAVYLGFEGSQVILGSALGIAFARATDVMLLTVEDKAPFASFAWSCICAALGALLLQAWCRQTILATVAPLVGGLLVVSGSGTILAQCGALAKLSPDVIWLHAAGALLGNAGYGLFTLQCMLCMLSSAIFAIKNGGEKQDSARLATPSPGLALIPMGLGLFFGSLSTATGLGCTLIHKCPSWLTPAKEPFWPLVGGLAWMVVSLLGAFVQLSSLPGSSDYTMLKSKRSKAPN